MAKFNNKKGEGSQSLNTASLPDIVFMLLFFFMVVTKIKDKEMLVTVRVPQATEIVKIKNKNVISYIYVGKPMESKQALYGTATRIQLNDAFRDDKYIPTWVEEEKKKKSQELIKLFTVSLKADKEVKMGIVTDVKTRLRKSNALKLIYAVNPGAKK